MNYDGLRIIPAGAGSTLSSAPLIQSQSAHPRWRGEHSFLCVPTYDYNGSSPLARGAPLVGFRHCLVARLIPAGAGSTCSIPPGRPCCTAHPRWRGEHELLELRYGIRDGSSPLARGAQNPGRTYRLTIRLIPAGAGSTTGLSLTGPVSPAHPRWRGEHFYGTLVVASHCGSSPLARGAPTQATAFSCTSRLIPAGAGSTPGTHSAGFCWSAHPRWRGEH